MDRNYVLGNQVIFDVLKREIVACDHVVNLGGREAAILKLLCEQSNHILSKDEIHEQVWGRVLVSETSLTKAISNLRKSLALFNELSCEIKTVPKEGYMLILDGESADQLSSEEIPTLAIKSIVSSTKSTIHPSYISSTNEAISSPVRGSFWFTMLFSAALLASIITVSMMLFLK